MNVVYFTPYALEKASFLRACTPNEVGGMLKFRNDEDTVDLIVDDIIIVPHTSSPGKVDFDPDGWRKFQVDNAESPENLIGHFHTHPAGVTKPSTVDENETWCLHKGKPFFIMCIYHGGTENNGFYVRSSEKVVSEWNSEEKYIVKELKVIPLSLYADSHDSWKEELDRNVIKPVVNASKWLSKNNNDWEGWSVYNNDNANENWTPVKTGVYKYTPKKKELQEKPETKLDVDILEYALEDYYKSEMLDSDERYFEVPKNFDAYVEDELGYDAYWFAAGLCNMFEPDLEPEDFCTAFKNRIGDDRTNIIKIRARMKLLKEEQGKYYE